MKKIILSLIIIISVISLSVCIQKEDKQSYQALPYEEEPGKHYVEESIVIDINEQIDQYIKQMSVEEKIGQVLMPAFRNFNYQDSVEVLTESIEKVITDYKVGGVILFKENIITKEQTQALIHDLQEKSKIPLWIGVDEEGGIVSRIASNPDMGFETIPTAFEIGETANKELAYNTGEQLGAMLTELGFNMNFAPVADVWSNPDNKVIGKRSFGNDPHKVSEMVNEVAKGLQEQDVLPVIKHFPGHGDTAEDTHVGRAFVNLSLQELQDRELIPFQKAINNDIEAIMVAHVELPQIDQGVPATLSHPIITGLLKNQMNFQGLIITDALDMEAITSQFGKGEAALQSFLAGTDVLLMPDIAESYHHLLKAYQDGIITDQRLDHSISKILHMKHKYGLLNL